MLKQVIELLPDAVSNFSPSLLLGAAAVAAVLALVGARFSRSILTLVTVAAGTFVGLHVPHWMGWSIDPMGTAFGGAVILGLSGYMLHRTWIGLGISTLIAAWAGTITWIILGGGTGWQWPSLSWSDPTPAILSHLWQSMPGQLAHAFPASLGIGATVGAFLALLWPKFSRVLLYSLGGLTVAVIAGAIGFGQTRPELLAMVPEGQTAQLAIFFGAVGLCMIVQWMLLPRVAKLQPNTTASEKRPANKAAKAAIPSKTVASAKTGGSSPDERHPISTTHRHPVSVA